MFLLVDKNGILSWNWKTFANKGIKDTDLHFLLALNLTIYH